MNLASEREIARVANPRALVAAAGVHRSAGDSETADTLVAAACALSRERAETARLRAMLAAIGVFA